MSADNEKFGDWINTLSWDRGPTLAEGDARSVISAAAAAVEEHGVHRYNPRRKRLDRRSR